MIEVCLSNGQRFFVKESEEAVEASVRSSGQSILDGYTSKTPGETSRVWGISARHIVSFSDADEPD